MFTLFINGAAITSTAKDFAEAVAPDTGLTLRVGLDLSAGFSANNESSDMLLEFAPYITAGSVNTVELKNEANITVIYSTKYDHINDIALTGSVDSADLFFALNFTTEE